MVTPTRGEGHRQRRVRPSGVNGAAPRAARGVLLRGCRPLLLLAQATLRKLYCAHIPQVLMRQSELWMHLPKLLRPAMRTAATSRRAAQAARAQRAPTSPPGTQVLLRATLPEVRNAHM